VTLFLVSLAIILAAGCLSLASGRSRRVSAAVGALGCALGCLLGLVTPFGVVCGLAPTLEVSLPWSMPFGTLSLAVDPLSAWFLLPLFVVSLVSAIYGRGYLAGNTHVNTGLHWFSYNLLVLGMALVVVSHNGLFFMLAWEVMSLASFFLVCSEHHDPEVTHAGWVYFVATHIGSAFLLVLFLVMGKCCGSLDFSACVGYPFAAGTADVLFVCAFLGFGAKAGFLPLHVWLPLAHPAAPSHVSAVMSGVMIKMGIYGLLRVLALVGPPHTWWAATLVVVGCTSGVLGVLLALGQHDIKRLLAYHSVENIGIIALGMGLGLLGVCANLPVLAALGFAGALLHVVNHAFFKGLLFLSAGAVAHATGTRDIDALGGVIKKMPITGISFLVGSAAICGLPPLNGFVSEFLIYLGAFKGVMDASALPLLLLLGTGAALALIGGLAVACFTKASGVVFLGEPRSTAQAEHECRDSMTGPMIVLGGLCAAIGLGFSFVLPVMAAPVSALVGATPDAVGAELTPAALALRWVTGVCVLAALLGGTALVLRNRALRGRAVRRSPTWDCGYARPQASMQYTASSYAAPTIEFFRQILGARRTVTVSDETFPRRWAFHSEVPDVYLEKFFVPLFRGADWLLSKLRWLQGGRVHIYVLYVAVTLLALLVWKLVIRP
jgi:hydrogenase-4 component B